VFNSVQHNKQNPTQPKGFSGEKRYYERIKKSNKILTAAEDGGNQGNLF
jgi:hypothetical protein